MAYSSNSIKQGFILQGLLETSLFTLAHSGVAVAHGRPGPVDACAAAREQEVIVEFVLLDRGACPANEGGAGALDGEDDGRVV